MARLTADPEVPQPDPAEPALAGDRWLGLGLVVALVVLAVLRIALGGWAPLAPDDARYLYVGLSILDGHGPVTPSGSTFLLRSPVYGLALATGSSLVGGDPLVGARLVALGLSLLALAGALRLGWLLAGPGGAVGTAFALVAAALVWRLVPSLRIDLPQTAAIVATMLAVWRPTVRRWAVGGLLLGLAILIKETALPLLILPVALVGSVPPARLARLAAVFIGAAVLTAAWWWVVVWASTGQLFPLNALSVIEARDVDVALRVDRSTAFLLAIAIAGWGIVAWRAVRSPGLGPRLLLVAAIGLAPAALYAASLGLNARNFAGLAVLSAVAVGAGGAWLVAGLRQRRTAARPPARRASRRSPWSRWRPWPSPRPSSASATRAGSPPTASGTSSPVGSLRTPRRAGGSSWHSANASRWRCGSTATRTWRSCRSPGSMPDEPPGTYLWMGLRDRQLFGYRRAAWTAAMAGRAGGDPADLLVLVGPHPFTPFALTATPETAIRLGLSPATILEVDGDRAEILDVDPATAGSGAGEVPLHLSAEAAAAWLDLAGGDAAAGRLLDARPVVDGDADGNRGPARSAWRGRLLDTGRNGLCRPRTRGNLPGLTRTGRLGTTVAYLHRTVVRRSVYRLSATESPCSAAIVNPCTSSAAAPGPSSAPQASPCWP